MYNPFAKDLEILQKSSISYDFLIKSLSEDDVKYVRSIEELKKVATTAYFEPFKEELSQERIDLVNEITNFINNPVVIQFFYEKGGNVAKIFEEVNGLLIRLKRFNLILNPTIYEFKFKSGSHIYNKSSAVWINDSGAKNKNFSRNFGNLETDKKKVVENMLVKSLNAKILHNIFPWPDDNVLAVINNKKWYFIIDKELENLIKTATLIDMWQLYKKIYK